MESNGCVWRINNAVECVNVGLRFDRHELEAQTKFASQQSELLRAAVHFLTRCRTIDEHRQMVSHFCACRCNMNIKRVRDLHKRCPRRLSQFGTSAKAGMASGLFNVSPDVVIAQMADLMVEFINFALVKMTPNRFHTSKWPNSPQDLLPFGIDHTICALHHWAIEPAPLERNMAYRMAYLFSLVYDAFAHELCQPLEDGSFKHDLPFVMAILHFGEILDEFDDDLEKAAALGLPMPPIADLRYAAPTSREVIKRVDQFCGAVLRTWFMIQHAKGRMVMGGGNLTLVLSTNDDRFKPILDRLSLVCRRADPSSEIGHIPLEIGRLEESGPRGRRTRSSSSSNSDPADSIFNKSYSEKLGITWVHLLSVRSWGCLYPHCPLSVADGMNTRLCAKCGLIPYCGTDVSDIIPFTIYY